MTIIDAHHHVWDLGRARYDWLAAAPDLLRRSFSFEEAEVARRRCGVQAVVLVQAADEREDTDWMLSVASNAPEIVAVVAYAPLEDPRATAAAVTGFRDERRVVGVRTLIHNQPDADWLLQPSVDESLGMLEAAELSLDIVAVLPRHLEVARIVAERHPGLRIVIDHLGHPPLGGSDRDLRRWSELIAAVADRPLMHAKVSGLYATVGDPDGWTVDLLRPVWDRAVTAFGPDRLMIGSDWPVDEIAGGYERVWTGLTALTDRLHDEDRDRVLGGTAESFYRIDTELLEAARRTGTTT